MGMISRSRAGQPDFRGSILGRGKKKIIWFFKASRPALGPTQPPIEWIPATIFLEVKRPGRELNTHLHLNPC